MTEVQVIKSWRSCGIPARYTNMARSFSQLSGLGDAQAPKAKLLLDLIKTPSFRSHVTGQRLGLSWIDEDEELFAVLARSIAVNLSVPIVYTDLSVINQPRNTGLYEACNSGDIKALFIKRFYCPALPNAFSDADKLRMELNLQWIADRGISLFLHFEVLPHTRETDWWSPSFIRLLSKLSPTHTHFNLLECLT